MAYVLKEVVIRTDNSDEGIKKISELWQDVSSGKIPILFDSQNNFQTGISPISKYTNYESNETGEYDLSIMGVKSDFFKKMDELVNLGEYKKYEASNDDLFIATKKAWEQVWNDKSLARAFTTDYESSVPNEYTKDGKAHCYLYIAIK